MKLKALMKISLATLALSMCAASGGVGATTADPVEDAAHFGPPDRILFWSQAQKVAGFRNMDKIVWTREVRAGDKVLPLPEAGADLSGFEFRHNGNSMSVADYFNSQNVAGLLVIKDGKIVYERYGLGNTRNTRWLSFSVTKSVVSMLVGAAISDGFIAGIDEPVSDYLPRLKGSAYDQVTIGNVLQMSSGVEWNEDYADPQSDIARADLSTLGTFRQLRQKQVVAPPGEKFNYNTAETNLVGTLLRSAVGNNLSTYLSEKIWRPFGMQADANWMLSEPGGGENGGCCISATLRDYGRIGMFALANGRLADGTEVLPSDWMARSVAPSPGNKDYGYLWWLNDGGSFRAQGIFGQDIFIDPNSRIVIAQQSAREEADRPEDWSLQDSFYKALIQVLESQP